MADAKFRQGFGVLQSMEFSFDAVIYHYQMPELAVLANAFPDAVIVLNHIGRPLGIGPYAGRRDDVFQVWQRNISDLARCPNVVVKVGGLGNPVSGFDWHIRPKPPTSQELTAETSPYYLHAIEAFGPERCMFESNSPVDKVSPIVCRVVEHLQANHRGFFRRGRGRVVPKFGDACLPVG